MLHDLVEQRALDDPSPRLPEIARLSLFAECTNRGHSNTVPDRAFLLHSLRWAAMRCIIHATRSPNCRCCHKLPIANTLGTRSSHRSHCQEQAELTTCHQTRRVINFPKSSQVPYSQKVPQTVQNLNSSDATPTPRCTRVRAANGAKSTHSQDTHPRFEETIRSKPSSSPRQSSVRLEKAHARTNLISLSSLAQRAALTIVQEELRLVALLSHNPLSRPTGVL